MLSLSLTDALTAALRSAGLAENTRFASVCAGVAGYTAKKRRAEFLELLETLVSAETYRLEPDYVIAYWGATEGEPGIVVIAGTGAVVYGRNENGETWREDGNGFLLGDKGSAFYIGRWALHRTLRNLRQERELKEFDHKLLAQIGAADADDLIEWTYRDFSPTRIADVAKSVCKWAEEGDELAMRHVDGAANILHEYAVQVAYRLEMQCESSPVFLCGGLWQNSEYIKARFQSGHSNPAPPAAPTHTIIRNIREPKHDSAYGAAFLAMKERCGDV